MLKLVLSYFSKFVLLRYFIRFFSHPTLSNTSSLAPSFLMESIFPATGTTTRPDPRFCDGRGRSGTMVKYNPDWCEGRPSDWAVELFDLGTTTMCESASDGERVMAGVGR